MSVQSVHLFERFPCQQVELVLHLLLVWDFYSEGLALAALVGGVAAHLAYLRLMRQFPYIELSSARGLISVGERAGTGCQALAVRSKAPWQQSWLLMCRSVHCVQRSLDTVLPHDVLHRGVHPSIPAGDRVDRPVRAVHLAGGKRRGAARGWRQAV